MGTSETVHPRGDTSITGERQVLELIATGTGLDAVLDALCRLIDRESGLISAIYLLDGDARQLTFAAGPRVPDAWQQVTKSVAASPTNGACGAALHKRD